MSWLRRSGTTACIVLLVLAGALGGCGGGSSNSERARLINQLKAQAGSLPPELSSCVLNGARALPIAELRAVAATGANSGSHVAPVTVRLVTTCIQQGKGVSALRLVIAQRVATTIPSTLPAAFRTCVERGAAALSATRISELIATYATAGEEALKTQGEQIGRRLAIGCLTQPGALAALRGLFLKPLERFAQSSRYPKSFRECVLHKAEQVPAERLKQFVLHPEKASTIGRALGESFAHECLAKRSAA